ncbi:hypothetical protein DLD77_08130 [Chitinophaga alhagiae]|uniref:Uncharacterized protein n=1 Tax=Chitinophaga alhagiae TaxID=2203219 RepID=A0ABM6WCL9_9BACT|nr:hypothetical protein [Chitinophaga alhagiae]AWO01665.1 hypothetical protein DLD77_08130 [Chitinophaga alhagiae]
MKVAAIGLSVQGNGSIYHQLIDNIFEARLVPRAGLQGLNPQPAAGITGKPSVQYFFVINLPSMIIV